MVPDAADPHEARRTRRGFLRLAGGAGAAGVAAVGAGAASVVTAVPAGAATTSGAELGYAETVAPATTTTSVALPNLALAIPVGDGPIAVEYGAYVQSSIDNGMVKLYLMRGSTPVHEVGGNVAGRNGVLHLAGRVRLPAGASTTATFTVLLANWTVGATVRALAMPLNPAFVQAHRL